MTEQFNIAMTAHNASVARLNTIGTLGAIHGVQRLHAYRLELKTTLRTVRQLIAATNGDTELQACFLGMLKNLKRMHYSMIVVEACETEMATRRN